MNYAGKNLFQSKTALNFAIIDILYKGEGMTATYIFTFQYWCTRLLSVSPTLILQLPHTCTHTTFSLHTQSFTQASTTFYSGDHNFLMTEVLVSLPPFCTPDLDVNNSTQGARKVGPLKQQVQSIQEAGHTEKSFIPFRHPPTSYSQHHSQESHSLCLHRAVY